MLSFDGSEDSKRAKARQATDQAGTAAAAAGAAAWNQKDKFGNPMRCLATLHATHSNSGNPAFGELGLVTDESRSASIREPLFLLLLAAWPALKPILNSSCSLSSGCHCHRLRSGTESTTLCLVVTKDSFDSVMKDYSQRLVQTVNDLRAFDVFQEAMMGEQELQKFALHFRRHKVPSGTQIIAQNKPCDSVLFLVRSTTHYFPVY